MMSQTPEMFRFAAVIVAAGSGSRFGGTVPKQFLPLGNGWVLDHALSPFLAEPRFEIIALVVDRDHLDDCRSRYGAYGARVVVVEGGSNRQDSVLAGLAALPEAGISHVAIHDGARPLLLAESLQALIGAASTDRAATLALPVTDTIIRREETGKLGAIPRDNAYRVQTPQLFPLDALRVAHAKAYGAAPYTDDTTLMQDAGMITKLVVGHEDNLKITHPGDLERAETILRQRGQKIMPYPVVRVGQGYDIHTLGPGDGVWLCGIKIPHDRALQGHSDADVALHALTDALLATIAAGDIGDHFPPSDMRWKGASSDRFLAHAAKLVSDAGGTITLCDVTIIAESPKIGPYREQMRTRIANILDIQVSIVSVKATTNERIGAVGRQEGICALASATVMFES